MASPKANIDEIIRTGGQYATTNRYRHPSSSPFIISSDRGTARVFDIEKMKEMLDTALDFLEGCGKKKQQILFVSTRQESVDIVKNTAEAVSMPYMVNRWIGGTLSNFKNIRSRVGRLEKLKKDRDEGNWAKHTKKERVLLNRELAKLETKFSGVVKMETMPDAVFILDTRKERKTLKEAIGAGIPVVGFSNADADITKITYPIVGNIYSREAVEYILGLVQSAYETGVKNAPTGNGGDDSEESK